MIPLILLLSSCGAGDARFTPENPAGFWYDFGFLPGVICIWGGGSHISCKSSIDKKRGKEWEEIGGKIEKKMKGKIRERAAKGEEFKI